MKYWKLMTSILIVILLQSCKTSRVSNSSNKSTNLFNFQNNKTIRHDRYCIISYNDNDINKFDEKVVTQNDSIEIIKNEFQNLLSELRLENFDSEVDTISSYKLRFISENHKNEQLQGFSSQNNVLKKCYQNIELKHFIKTPGQIRSYLKKYLIVYSMPIVDYGNTYVRTFDSQYYFEKVISNK